MRIEDSYRKLVEEIKTLTTEAKEPQIEEIWDKIVTLGTELGSFVQKKEPEDVNQPSVYIGVSRLLDTIQFFIKRYERTQHALSLLVMR